MNAVQPDQPSRRRLIQASAAALAVQSLSARRGLSAATKMLAMQLQAGAAELVATPEAVGTFLIGALKPSTGIHDELWVRALVLDDGTMRAVLVTLDYLGFDLEYTAKLVAAASEAAGVPVSHVLLNCSHTHSAPLTVPWGPWHDHQGGSFYGFLPERVKEVVQLACGRLRPASLRSYQAPVQIGINRRLLHGDRVIMATNPVGAILPWTDVLAVEGADCSPIAVFFTYAAHPVIIHEASTLISADYPGFAVERLKETRGGKSIFLFGQGCAGNINAFPLRGGIDAARAVGRELGDAVSRALESPPRAQVSGGMKMRVLDLQLPFQAPPEIAVIQTMLAGEKNTERRRNLQRLLGVARRGNIPSLGCPIRVLSLGSEFGLVTMPHEPFAEYHHTILAMSPYVHTLVLGYTNGMQAYLPTAHDLRLGERAGYEASTRGAAFMYETSLPVVPETEAMIHEALKRGLQG